MTVTIPATDPILAKLRLEVADDTLDAGPLPDHGNIPDETLLALYVSEGQHVGRAAARIFEYLAKKWAAMPTELRLEREWERFESMKNFRAEAQRLRKLHGYYSGTRPGGYPIGAAPTEVIIP